MIITSSHKNWKSKKYEMYSISGNRGKDANYNGKCYPKLAPKYSFWEIWHYNIGKRSDEENNMFYIEKYYEHVLSKLDSEEVYKELDNSVLLCYEDNNDFCHRHIVSAWFELTLGVETCEAKINKGKIEIVDRPAYIKEYLQKVMNKEQKDQTEMSKICKKKNK